MTAPAKILRNTTSSIIFIADTGVSIPANYSYVISPQNYAVWAASSQVTPYIQNGNLVVNSGFMDLDPIMGDFLIKTGIGSWFGNDSNVPGPTITDALNYLGYGRFINKRFYNETVNAVPSAEHLHVNYTVPVGKYFIWVSSYGVANSWTRWRIEIDGIIYLSDYNAFDKPKTELYIGPIKLNAGQNMKIYATNVSQLNTLSEIETFLYGLEENI